mmetsp:Transcript_23765/g.34661  ORF Transcript_23765/g.34661 Transcript_23765/m.34661 type:complete len:87 (-) Transcript_23765:152-412(-)
MRKRSLRLCQNPRIAYKQHQISTDTKSILSYAEPCKIPSAVERITHLPNDTRDNEANGGAEILLLIFETAVKKRPKSSSFCQKCIQ